MDEADYSARVPEIPRHWTVKPDRFGESDAVWRPVPDDVEGVAERKRQRSLRLAARTQSVIVAVVRDRMLKVGIVDQAALARRAGMSTSVVSRLMTGAAPMSLVHVAAFDLVLAQRGDRLLSDLLSGKGREP